MDRSSDDTTLLIRRWRDGDLEALDRLIPQVYADLRAMAARQMAGFRQQQTLQPTALVNDVFVRLLGAEGLELVDTRHFFNVAARVMRQMLIDRSRRAGTEKRGGDWQREAWSEALALPAAESVGVAALDEALTQLEGVDARLARVVELRCFVGLSAIEIGRLLGVDKRTVHRDWTVAKAWLRDRLEA